MAYLASWDLDRLEHLCDHCGFKAQDKWQLRNHVLKIMKVLVIQILCTWCEYTKIAHESFWNECYMCDHKATSNGRLTTQIHGGIRFSSSICQWFLI